MTDHDAEALIRRVVDDAMNGDDLDVLDQLASPQAAPGLPAVPHGVPRLAPRGRRGHSRR
jgi:hypothetical protein